MKQSASNLEHTKTYPATTIADAASQTGRGAEGLSLSLSLSLCCCTVWYAAQFHTHPNGVEFYGQINPASARVAFSLGGVTVHPNRQAPARVTLQRNTKPRRSRNNSIRFLSSVSTKGRAGPRWRNSAAKRPERVTAEQAVFGKIKFLPKINFLQTL